jgi:CMP-N-acetylneuraminic acid synthetase/spore coat polysaccharide biosynthesis predicted glycosyltransferase SpsG
LSQAVLVLIPARGGSKGIPRKNVRSLGGRPLIAYAIETALASQHAPDVVVTSEDDEILNIASKLGAQVHRRDAMLSADDTTLDEVVIAAYREIVASAAREYDVVVTLQPTSPLLTTNSLDQAISAFHARPELETLLSATDDTHLTWTVDGDQYVPAYTERLNRQYLEPSFRETGGLIACRARTLQTGSRIAQPATLMVIAGAEAIDIDSREDWALCEWYLRSRDVLFVVAGYPEIGLGHVHNALTIANELVRHRVRFLVTRPSELAERVISSHHYEVHRQARNDIVGDILQLAPDVVINDRLDTEAGEIARIRSAGTSVINFEDQGSGAAHADLVVNAIYPEPRAIRNHFYGPRYFCVRADFALTRPRDVSDEVRSVLVTFGGVDPNNLTRKVVDAIHGECQRRGIELRVVAGRGYTNFESLASFADVLVDRAVVDMADRIRAADVIFTSAGRTVFEIACLGTPAVVLSQNAREQTHFFASSEHGFINLGLGVEVNTAMILRTFIDLVDSPAERRRMQGRMLDNDLRGGTARVVRLIEDTFEDHGTR